MDAVLRHAAPWDPPAAADVDGDGDAEGDDDGGDDEQLVTFEQFDQQPIQPEQQLVIVAFERKFNVKP